MGLETRPITPGELPQFVAMLEATSGRSVTEEVIADARAAYVVDRTLAVFDAGRIVAGTGSDLLELTVPGPRPIAVARLTHGGVLPTHRLRGMITGLLTRQLREARDRGEAIAVMTTTGPGTYRRVGFSPATTAMAIELEPAEAGLGIDTPRAHRLRLVDAQAEAKTLETVFDRHRAAQPGQISRTSDFWRRWLLDRPRDRKSDAGDRFTVLAEDDAGAVEGYLTYRFLSGAPLDQPVRVLEVEDLVSATDEARRSLWSYCASFLQVSLVTALNAPIDEPLFWMLADPRRLRVTRLRDFLWLRLVDVQATLSSRRYATAGALVLQVTDEACPENAGRYLLEGGPDGSSCVASAAEPNLKVDTADLAAAYLGGSTFTSLVRAGRVGELTAGAASRADALFASRPAPWTITDW